MWPFKRKKTLEESSFFQGFTDWHSHLLPGVDDGVQTLEESLQILSEYELLGICEVWLTPHIMEDEPNTTQKLRECFEVLVKNYNGKLRLHLAAENMLDNLFEERLMDNDLLPMGEEGNYLLVETSYFNPPMDLTGTLDRIKAKGYFPVLAHPERYNYMDMEDYFRLRAMNVLFQLNLPSLAGFYGKQVQRKAEKLVSLNMYDFQGCDTHALKSFLNLKQSTSIKI